MNSGKSLLDGRRLVNQKTCNESSKGENSISSNALYGDGENTEESLQMFDAKAGEQNEENNMSLQS